MVQVVQQRQTHTREAWNQETAYLVHVPECLIRINLVLKAGKIPGMLLFFSLYGNPEDAGSNISGEMFKQQSR